MYYTARFLLLFAISIIQSRFHVETKILVYMIDRVLYVLANKEGDLPSTLIRDIQVPHVARVMGSERTR